MFDKKLEQRIKILEKIVDNVVSNQQSIKELLDESEIKWVKDYFEGCPEGRGKKINMFNSVEFSKLEDVKKIDYTPNGIKMITEQEVKIYYTSEENWNAHAQLIKDWEIEVNNFLKKKNANKS